MKQLDGLLHGDDRGSHKRREADELNVAFLDGLEHLLRVDVATQIKDGVAVVIEQHLDDVLTDVVDVALDGGHADFALVGNLAGGHQALDGVKAHTRGLGRGHELRQEELSLVKEDANLVEGGDKVVVDEVHGVVICQKTLGLGCNLAFAARDDHATNRVVVAVSAGGASSGRGVGRYYLSRRRVRGDLVRIGPAGVAFDVSGRALVLNAQDAIAVDGIHKALGARVHDGGIEARAKGGGQKDRAQQRAGRQAKADVRHAERALDAQAFLAQGHGAQNLFGLALIGRGGHDQAVDEDAVRSDTVARSLGYDALGDGEASLGGIGDAVFVEREADNVGAVVGD